MVNEDTLRQSDITDMFLIHKGLEVNKIEKGKMYLRLFHGRNRADDRLGDWGFNGPTFGPLLWAHTTYLNHFRIAFENEDEGFEVLFHKDMIEYDGKFYGDWSIYIANKTGVPE